MDKAAKEKLVEQHMTLVQGLAAQLRKGVARGVEYEDLVSYGAKGLSKPPSGSTPGTAPRSRPLPTTVFAAP